MLKNDRFIRFVSFVYDEDKEKKLLFYSYISTILHNDAYELLKIVKSITNDIKLASTNQKRLYFNEHKKAEIYLSITKYITLLKVFSIF